MSKFKFQFALKFTDDQGNPDCKTAEEFMKAVSEESGISLKEKCQCVDGLLRCDDGIDSDHIKLFLAFDNHALGKNVQGLFWAYDFVKVELTVYEVLKTGLYICYTQTEEFGKSNKFLVDKDGSGIYYSYEKFMADSHSLPCEVSNYFKIKYTKPDGNQMEGLYSFNYDNTDKSLGPWGCAGELNRSKFVDENGNLVKPPFDQIEISNLQVDKPGYKIDEIILLEHKIVKSNELHCDLCSDTKEPFLDFSKIKETGITFTEEYENSCQKFNAKEFFEKVNEVFPPYMVMPYSRRAGLDFVSLDKKTIGVENSCRGYSYFDTPVKIYSTIENQNTKSPKIEFMLTAAFIKFLNNHYENEEYIEIIKDEFENAPYVFVRMGNKVYAEHDASNKYNKIPNVKKNEKEEVSFISFNKEQFLNAMEAIRTNYQTFLNCTTNMVTFNGISNNAYTLELERYSRFSQTILIIPEKEYCKVPVSIACSYSEDLEGIKLILPKESLPDMQFLFEDSKEQNLKFDFFYSGKSRAYLVYTKKNMQIFIQCEVETDA